jgi:hypothetical protein
MCASVQVDLALQRQVSLPFVRPHYFKLSWLKTLSPSIFFSQGPTADAGFLYGYVFFRQKKDDRIRRGYFQVR